MLGIEERKAFKEVYIILNYLDEEEFNKIPKEIYYAIEENMDMDYEYHMNKDLDLEKQEMLSCTRAILFNLFRDYLSEPWQKEKILKMQEEERKQEELLKQQKYNSDVFADKVKNKEKKINKEDNENKDIIKTEKENIFRKIMNKIKAIFVKSK